MTGLVLSHLQRLEAESIYIIREVAAQFRNPVMLYSIGKDSSVMLHLALKAFFPAKPPFPLLHVDTYAPLLDARKGFLPQTLLHSQALSFVEADGVDSVRSLDDAERLWSMLN